MVLLAEARRCLSRLQIRTQTVACEYEQQYSPAQFPLSLLKKKKKTRKDQCQLKFYITFFLNKLTLCLSEYPKI